MSPRLPINPKLLTWARERAGLDALALAGRFPKLSEWEAGELQPTLRQLEDFTCELRVADVEAFSKEINS